MYKDYNLIELKIKKDENVWNGQLKLLNWIEKRHDKKRLIFRLNY